MTLIIAGYRFSEDLSACNFNLSSSANVSSPPRRGANPDGIFIAADSAITNADKTLLNDFRKIHRIPVKLWWPDFLGSSFKGYKTVCRETEIAVAFAGGTLTAQHCLSSITKHLSELRVSCKRDSSDSSIQYIIIKDGEPNPLNEQVSWGSDVFTDPTKDSKGLLTADYVADVVRYSLQDSVKSAGKHMGSHALATSFVAGIQCPENSSYHLYEFPMMADTSVKVEKTLVPHGQVAVLGVSRFTCSAQSRYTEVMNAGGNTEEEMFDFLNAAIDQFKNKGDKGIGYPSTLNVLSNQELKEIRRKN